MTSSRFMELVEAKKKRDAEAASAAAASQAEAFDSDLVPEAPYEVSEQQQQLDDFIKRIDIVDAYVKYTPYGRPRILPGQKESIKTRCPNPQHTDEKPSYWINTDKQVGNCGSCEAGFDVKDIAAFHFGYPVPEYKKNGDFPKLMRDIAESYGFHVERSLGGQDVVWRESDDAENETDNSDISDAPVVEPEQTSDKSDNSGILPNPEPENPEQVEEALAPGAETTGPIHSESNVEELFEGDGLEIQLPTLEWEQVAPGKDTFLDRYMQACRGDEAPEEYHFFNALTALGFAAGREVTLRSKLPVYGNLFICHLGKSGAGKSTASRHLKTVLKRCLPYKSTDPNSRGVLTVTPSSAEVLIDSFSKPVTDPTDPKRIVYYASVKGLIDFSEMSGLIGRAARMGNLLKPTMMDFFDMSSEVRSQSRGSGTVVAQDPFASCSTTVQPAALRDLLRNSDDASGFLNRWVYVGGTEKKRTIMGTGEVDLDRPVEALDEILGWTASFGAGERITWTPETIAEMQQFFDAHVYPLSKRSDTNIFVRLDLLFLKLVLLMCVNEMQRVVTHEILGRVKLMYGYLVACYGIPADEIGNSLENEMTEAIIYQMKRIGGKDGATLNAIALALKRRKYPKDLILKNIKALIELGFVEERIPNAGKQGRPTKRYAYVA